MKASAISPFIQLSSTIVPKFNSLIIFVPSPSGSALQSFLISDRLNALFVMRMSFKAGQFSIVICCSFSRSTCSLDMPEQFRIFRFSRSFALSVFTKLFSKGHPSISIDLMCAPCSAYRLGYNSKSLNCGQSIICNSSIVWSSVPQCSVLRL